MPNSQSVERERYTIIKALAAAFPHNKVKPETIQIYLTFLADMEIAALKRAAMYCMANSEFFPTMKALREAAQESDTENRLPTAGEAWGEVQEAVSAHGSWGKPEWSQPIIRRAIQAMGGWRDFCLSEDPAGVLRGQFLKIYATLEQRQVKDERAAIEGSNQAWEQITATAKQKALTGGKG